MATTTEDDTQPHLLTNNNNNNNTTNLTSGGGGGVDTDLLSFHHLPPEGQQCMEDFWDSLPLDGVWCNATWDSLHCWEATKEDVVITKACGDVFKDYPTLNQYPHAVASRECGKDGVWSLGGWTNYSQCLNVIDTHAGSVGSSTVVVAVRYVTFLGALLSLLTLIITIFIFTYYRICKAYQKNGRDPGEGCSTFKKCGLSRPKNCEGSGTQCIDPQCKNLHLKGPRCHAIKEKPSLNLNIETVDPHTKKKDEIQPISTQETHRCNTQTSDTTPIPSHFLRMQRSIQELQDQMANLLSIFRAQVPTQTQAI
ncbi:hypothetical protein Pmani_025470 [Petrolisthes manimaculis]|uniref:G-protein coupled receptors family 2 profile 1 domain-containing protein n=1 Tax=Petrolisthes manimaculis TaxID=1843537 RepID=A0AAE1TXM4_9EUCA|nr:hypothetical protein Pmani_025470 [Petrolisthes manimaculis]